MTKISIPENKKSDSRASADQNAGPRGVALQPPAQLLAIPLSKMKKSYFDINTDEMPVFEKTINSLQNENDIETIGKIISYLLENGSNNSKNDALALNYAQNVHFIMSEELNSKLLETTTKKEENNTNFTSNTGNEKRKRTKSQEKTLLKETEKEDPKHLKFDKEIEIEK